MDYDGTSKKLYDGDYIIMVSDGVIEALDGDDKEEQMVRIIQNIDVRVPDVIASDIIEAAIQGKTGITDDMSVIVTGIFDTQINL